MYKRYLRQLLARLQPVKTWYLLVACLVMALTGALALRSNYTTMSQLRSAVYSADQQGGDVQAALQHLRSFVGSHMNTSLATPDGVYPPIQLIYTYDRLKQAEKARVDAINTQVYTDAQHHCEALFPNGVSGRGRVPCIEEYVTSHGVSANVIPQDMYKFDFVSPRWSPDLAGWSLVLSGLLLVLAAARILLGRLLRML